MKLQSALALFIWGSNQYYGNAFASISHSSTPLAFRTHSSFLGPSTRGGAVVPTASVSASTSLSATIDDIDVCPELVSEYISSDNWSLLSARGKQAIVNLITGDEGVGAQEHVYKDWPEAGVDDEGKIQLAEQVRCIRCNVIAIILA